jgi:hypothetical protein
MSRTACRRSSSSTTIDAFLRARHCGSSPPIRKEMAAAAVLPMTVVFGKPQPDPLQDEAIPVPAHILDAVTPRNTP